MAKRHPRPLLRCPHLAAPAVIECPALWGAAGCPLPPESANAPARLLSTVPPEGRHAVRRGADETRQR
jgi:hypothetical protein